MSDYVTTPNLGLFKPNYDQDDDQWGFHLNDNADILDTLLRYTATGGSTPRWAQDRAGERLSIKDLGAVGDGVHDDTPAFTAACALPDGSVVYIPANTTCLVQGGFTVSGKSVSFVGLDRHTSIIKHVTGTITANSFTFTGNGTLIGNLTFDFGGATNPNTSAFYSAFSFTNADKPTVRDVTILNIVVNIYAVTFSACTDITVDGCRMDQPTPSQTAQSKGIVIFAGTGATVRGRITNNSLTGTNTNFVSANRLYIAGNDISGWGVGAGIATGADPTSMRCVIVGNKCHDSMTGTDMFGVAPNGIEHWGTQCVVANNVCWNCAGAAISVGGKSNLIAANIGWDCNVVAAATGAAYSAAYSSATYNAAGSTFIGNKAFDSGVGRQNYGLWVSSLLTAPVDIYSNDFVGCVTGDIYGYSPTVVRQNQITSDLFTVGPPGSNRLTITPGAALTNPVVMTPAGSGGLSVSSGPFNLAGTNALQVGTSGTNNMFSVVPGTATTNAIAVSASGTGAINFNSTVSMQQAWNSSATLTMLGSTNWIAVGQNANANVINVRSAATGSRPVILTSGIDSNVDLALQCGGTGQITALSPLAIGAAGPTITSGAGAPATTTPAGSLYLRTGGATGTRLYVSAGAGTWNPVAGV